MAARVKLRTRRADDIDDLPAAYFDTIVVNSVVQYFPNAGYLIDVIAKAMRLLAPGGAMYLGDIRNNALLREFATEVQLDARRRRHGAWRACASGCAWRCSPNASCCWPRSSSPRCPQLGTRDSPVDIRLKDMETANELSRYRYEVVLRREPGEVRSLAGITRSPGTGSAHRRCCGGSWPSSAPRAYG